MVYPVEDSPSPDGERLIVPLAVVTSDPIILPDLKDAWSVPVVDREESKEDVDEWLYTWVANTKLSEELQRLAEDSSHLAEVMDELVEEESALEDRAFSLFRRSMPSEKAPASKDEVVKPASAAPESSYAPMT